MKKLIFVICCLLVTTAVYSQQYLSYEYDDAGNRISRTIFLGSKSAAVQQQEEIKETIAMQEIKIYPNPVESILSVSVTGFDNTISGEYFIYNLTGGLLERDKITSEHTTLDLSSFSSGTYLLQILINGEKTVWKIIKE